MLAAACAVGVASTYGAPVGGENPRLPKICAVILFYKSVDFML